MHEIVNHQLSIINRQRGVALLMVLLIVLAITILATGFLARADTELACGTNVLLRMQMDQLAESGLEHARGLVLHPQNVPAAFWANGATGLQLVPASRDYYDIRVSQDPNLTTNRCTFDITSKAYRLVEGRSTAECYLAATLRLDPCIALEVGAATSLWNGAVVYGDVYARNNLTNSGVINGDVFAVNFTNTGTQTGQLNPQMLSLAWPPVTFAYVSPNPSYAVRAVSVDPLAGPWAPDSIWRKAGDLTIGGLANIRGMLMVLGNLTVSPSASGTQIIAAPNLPALYVGGDLVIDGVNRLEIEGLVVVNGNVQISATAANIFITGGLFVGGTLISGPGSGLTVIADPMKAAVVAGAAGSETCWSPAAGGFFRSIRRL